MSRRRLLKSDVVSTPPCSSRMLLPDALRGVFVTGQRARPSAPLRERRRPAHLVSSRSQAATVRYVQPWCAVKIALSRMLLLPGALRARALIAPRDRVGHVIVERPRCRSATAGCWSCWLGRALRSKYSSTVVWTLSDHCCQEPPQVVDEKQNLTSSWTGGMWELSTPQPPGLVVAGTQPSG